MLHISYITIFIIIVISFNYLYAAICPECQQTDPAKWHTWQEWSVSCNGADLCSVGTQVRTRTYKEFFCSKDCVGCALYPPSCEHRECREANNGCEHSCDKDNNGICSCRSGFELVGRNQCNDIDECSNNNGGCSQRCHNSDGSYDCRCHNGYYLDVDGVTCIPYPCPTLRLNQCPSDSYSDHFGSVCINASILCPNGSVFGEQCNFNCPTGFGLATVQRTVGKMFAEDLVSVDFTNVHTSISCTYEQTAKWSIPSSEYENYICRRLSDPPKNLALSNLNILEHSDTKSEVGIISATHTGAILFSIEQSEGINSFIIENGKLKTLTVFRLLDLSDTTIDVLIRATSVDNPLMYTEKLFTINIINVNDPPQDIQISNSKFSDLTPIGHIIGNLSAIDYDSVTPLRSSNFIWNLIDNDNGNFELRGSSLILKKKQIHNTDFTHEITVQCTDRDLLPKFSTKVLFLSNENLNSQPIDISLIDMSSIYENASVNSVIGKLKSIDKDNDDIMFTDLSKINIITINSPICSSIAGNQTQCVADVVLSQPLDYETKNDYDVIIKATDTKGEFLVKEFNVKILNSNEQPYDILIRYNEINENSLPESFAGELEVLDYDVPSIHQCVIVDRNGPFKLRGLNIVLKANEKLNYEVQSSYNITVTCTDDGIPPLSLTKTFPIYVKDRNDEFRSVIFNQTKEVFEDMHDEIIGELKIIDEDISYDHICKITYKSNNMKKYVIIEKTNGINHVKLLNEKLDFELNRNIKFSFECTDVGDQNFTIMGDFTIRIKDANEAPLSPCSEITFVSFDSPIGTPVLKLSSKDPDNELFYQGITKKPKQMLSYTLSGTTDFRKDDTDMLYVKKKMESGKLYYYKIQVSDDGMLVLREEKNDYIFIQRTPKSEIFTCTIIAVDPTDTRIPFTIVLSSTQLYEKSNVGVFVGKFSVKTGLESNYRYNIIRQDSNSLNIENDVLMVSNSTYIDYKQVKTYQVIVSGLNTATGKIAYKLFVLNVIPYCSNLFEYRSNQCKCKNYLTGIRCDRNASLCPSPCVKDEICSTFVSSPKRCIPKENQIPVLLLLDFKNFEKEKYNIEDTVKNILQNPNDNTRKRRNTNEKIYIEAASATDVTTSTKSYTYIKFVPTDENINYELLKEKLLCPRFKNSNMRCVNEEDCRILQSVNIPCPYIFNTSSAPVTSNGSDSLPNWSYIIIAVGIVVLILIIIVIVFLRRHNRPIKDDVTFDANTNNLQFGNASYSPVSKEGSPVKNNLNSRLGPGGNQSMREISALKRKTDITIYDNKIFSPTHATSGSFEIHNPAYSASNATNRAYTEHEEKERNGHLYAKAVDNSHIYASVGKATGNPLYEKSFKSTDGYDSICVSNENTDEVSAGKFVDITDVEKSKSLDDLTEPDFKPIIRGPSVNQFRPEDDDKDKTFKKNIDLNQSESNT